MEVKKLSKLMEFRYWSTNYRLEINHCPGEDAAFYEIGVTSDGVQRQVIRMSEPQFKHFLHLSKNLMDKANSQGGSNVK